MDTQPIVPQPVQTAISPEQKVVRKKAPFSYAIILSMGVFLIIAGSIMLKTSKKSSTTVLPTQTPFASSFFETDSITHISSNSEFEKIFSESSGSNSSIRLMKTANLAVPSAGGAINDQGTSTTVERASQTNVQVLGIDEPDIVKTDGSTIFYGKESMSYYLDARPVMMNGISSKMMPENTRTQAETVLVGALPPSSMKMRSSLPVAGDMLIDNKNLVVFGQSETGALLLSGYNVANPGAPKKLWELPFDSRSQRIAARLYKDKIYLIVSTSPSLSRSSPMAIGNGQNKIQIPCTDIYVPSSRPTSDVVYTTLKIDPTNGAVEKKMSIVGQSNNPIVYMSQDSLYLNYYVEADLVSILNQFIGENRGVFPSFIEEKIKKLAAYDLSSGTKEVELSSIFSQYINSLDDDTRLKEENNLSNALSKFMDKNQRTFAYTGIVKFNLNDLSIVANGKVPGNLINQFALDEWKGNLRVATTVGSRGRVGVLGLNSNNNDSQVSDVYILNNKLEMQGSVKNLGKTEQIYSVRFIEDRGYVVTFRQTDPLYVLDLTNSTSPILKGELKIPGYSSYLHPLGDHLLLGIGRDNSQVKLSLFDVSNSNDPKEVSHYELANEYWSEALDNHHAFMQDSKYSIFFLPASRGGYVFSYDAHTINLVKALEAPQVKRALYMNDYLYIVSDTGISSFKEGTWEKAGDFYYEKPKLVPTSVPEPQPEISGGVELLNGTGSAKPQ